MKIAVLLGAAALITGLITESPAQSITVAGPGGPTQAAHRKAIFDPFTAETGIKVVEDEWDYNLGTLRAQVDSGAIKWDIMEVTRNILLPGCEENLLERVDWDSIPDKANYMPKGIHDCGVGGVLGAMVLAYNAKISQEPKNWADFWDLKKFPGKRGMWYTPVETLEFALLADGVAKEDVYATLAKPEGVDRAFKKLDEIKSSIVWWRSGAESMQRLASGEVSMTTAWSGRPVVADRDNKDLDLRIAWHAGSLREFDAWVMVKGAPHKEDAAKFLAFVARADVQANLAKLVPYGGPNTKMYGLLDASVLSNLPSYEPNAKDGIDVDYEFWLDHQDALVERFNKWAAN